MHKKTKTIVICGMFAAVLCVLCGVVIPVGPIPVSLATFAVILTARVLGVRRSISAVLIYILLGASGLPVFSGFCGGIGIIAGPTGGYIIGYILLTAAVGMGTWLGKGKSRTAFIDIASCAVGLVLCYIVGTIQFIAVTESELLYALAVCVYPFILPDIIKAAAAIIFAKKIAVSLPQSMVH